MEENSFFYKHLKKHKIPLEDLVGDEHLFKDVPKDWHVIVVDVENSTEAVSNGLHHDVNLTATGGITSVLNLLKDVSSKVILPYFFGGDGATFIVPPSLLEKVLQVLTQYRHNVKKNLFLSLKVGSIPVSEVYAANHPIRISKFAFNPKLTIPIVLGNGLKYAEAEIKAKFVDEPEDMTKAIAVNLEGMQCRWQEIAPLQKGNKVLCLLLDCPDNALQNGVYRDIIIKINDIFGTMADRNPISAKGLKLTMTIKNIRREIRARLGKSNIFSVFKNFLRNSVGNLYFIFSKRGRQLLKNVAALSYTLMIDGMLNSVISGSQENIDRLINYLDELEATGKIVYGIHITHASVLSCYVEDLKDKHIHFVDGTEGGFTSAALMYKAKLKAK